MSASEHLVVVPLEDGWVVAQQLPRDEGHTGGSFSRGYIAERNGQRAFLKALDYSEAFQPGIKTAEALQSMTAAYLH